MNVKIYVATHKASKQIPSEEFIPIHVGRNGQKQGICQIGDDTGDHISDKNGSFCELTALYWIWKNTNDQNFVGLFHYRRHLNLSLIDTPQSKWGVSEYSTIDENYLDINQLNSQGLQGLLGAYDLVLPEKWDVRQAGSKSMYEHFDRGQHHSIEDYNAALDVLKLMYPDYENYIDRVNNSYSGYFTNIFIMRRDIFNIYCDWLFSILFKLEGSIDISNYSVQEKRIFGFISEWLFNIFIEKYIDDNPHIRVRYTQRTFIHDTDIMLCPAPVYSSNNTAIVMAFNDGFVPYAGTAIQSLVEVSSSNRNYDIVIFDGGISAVNKNLIQTILSDHKNISIRYVDPNPLFKGLSLPVHLHISKDTYYRLLIPEVFSAYKRVIYMDGDMILKKDISHLSDVDLKGKSIAAVSDHVMAGFRKFKTLSVPYNVPAETYLMTDLNMADPSKYFQAGLIVYDINKSFSKIPLIKEILSSGKQYWFMDQDILNMVYYGDVFYLDSRWNVFHGNGNTKTFFEKLPAKERSDYFASRLDPFIIHYAGENKPWLAVDVDFFEEFWMVARKTVWYERMLAKLLEARSSLKDRNSKSLIRTILIPIERKVKKIKKKYRQNKIKG